MDDALEKIVDSGWFPIKDQSLQAALPATPASLLNTLSDAHPLSELTAVEQVVGTWLSANVLPVINQRLHTHRMSATSGDAKHYNPLNPHTLLKFLLARSLAALERHNKHDLHLTDVTTLSRSLIGVNRYNAINASFDIGDHVIEQLFASIAPHLHTFITPGSDSCIDETVFPHFGRTAAERGKLRNIPGKPHDYGMVAYVLAQPLALSWRTVCLGLCPTFGTDPVKPIEAALRLLRSLPRLGHVSLDGNHLIADSLWSHPTHVRLFSRLGLQFTVSVPEGSPLVPTELFAFAQEDLPVNETRTYQRNDLVLQVIQSSEDGEMRMTSVLSNLWRNRNSSAPASPSVWPYKIAQIVHKMMTSADIVAAFNLDPDWSSRSKETLIHLAMGWDVLRPEVQQSGSEPFTYEMASALTLPALREVHRQKLGRVSRTKKSKAQLLHDLFPGEVREHDESITQKKSQKRRLEIQHQISNRDEVPS